MSDNVVVQEVKPANVTKKKALRIFVGKFIVDFIETLSGSLPVTLLFVPANTEDVQRLVLILATPTIAAAVSAARRGWPTLKKWLSGEEDEVVDEGDGIV